MLLLFTTYVTTCSWTSAFDLENVALLERRIGKANSDDKVVQNSILKNKS